MDTWRYTLMYQSALALFLCLWFCGCASPDEDRFGQLFSGKLQILDLTYPLNSTNPYWPGGTYKPFQLTGSRPPDVIATRAHFSAISFQ